MIEELQTVLEENGESKERVETAIPPLGPTNFTIYPPPDYTTNPLNISAALNRALISEYPLKI